MPTPVPALATVLAVFACSACPPGAGAEAGEAFDDARAWRDLGQQVAFGPRPSGSEANERCRAWIEAELAAAGYTPRRESFRAPTPEGEVAFANVVAELKGSDARAGWIEIGTHFDTKRMPFAFVGANDGASSTAVVLELARVLKRGGARAHSYRFAFFDGEEALRPTWQGEDNTYGSRKHVALLKESGAIESLRAFVLLDLVGDADLVLTTDSLSDQRYMALFHAAAKRIGLAKHVGGRNIEVHDDHLPYMAAGVRSVNLIDFDYGPDNAWWHTQDDVVAHCSQQSLRAIGRISLAGLADLESALAATR